MCCSDALANFALRVALAGELLCGRDLPSCVSMAATQLHEHDFLDDRDAEIARLRTEVAYLRASLPLRQPPGTVNVKTAAALTHCSTSAIYKWASNGRIGSNKPAKRIWIDPATLPTV
jgi:hypothetical protein